jgi:hypothetical protein
MTPGKRRRREYAEWLPELDLHVDGRWDVPTKERQSEPVPVITRVRFGDEAQVLDESA